jgi:hypothetical protein
MRRRLDLSMRCGDSPTMDEMRSRRLSIARELATWGVAMPALMARIAQTLRMPNLSGRQKLDFEVIARHITTAFNAIGETPDPEASEATLYHQLIETTDRLRELIAAANVALDGLGKQ